MSKSKLAFFGGNPIRKKPYPKYNTITPAVIKSALEVMKYGSLSGFVARGNNKFLGGSEVIKLEKKIKNFFSSNYCVTVNSATSGLHSALMAAGVQAGDEVIVPPITMSATAASVLMCKAKPIFVDVDKNSFCIDYKEVVKALTKKTKAIIAVNIFGYPSELKKLRVLAEKYKIFLIEDNAQAPGAFHKGKYAGTWGHMGVLSFNVHKTIQCGEGGAILTDDINLAKKLQLIRNHSESVLDDWENIDPEWASLVGYNYRLTELQASIVTPQLKRLNKLNKERQFLANELTNTLDKFKIFKKFPLSLDCTHVYYLYPIIVKNNLSININTFLKALSAEGVQVSKYVPPTSNLPIFKKGNILKNSKKRGLCQKSITYENDTCNLCKTKTACQLIYNNLLVTNICRSPNTKKDILEFGDAIEKIIENIGELIIWERNEKRNL